MYRHVKNPFVQKS